MSRVPGEGRPKPTKASSVLFYGIRLCSLTLPCILQQELSCYGAGHETDVKPILAQVCDKAKLNAGESLSPAPVRGCRHGFALITLLVFSGDPAFCGGPVFCGDPVCCGDPAFCGGPAFSGDAACCGDPAFCGDPVFSGDPAFCGEVEHRRAYPSSRCRCVQVGVGFAGSMHSFLALTEQGSSPVSTLVMFILEYLRHRPRLQTSRISREK